MKVFKQRPVSSVRESDKLSALASTAQEEGDWMPGDGSSAPTRLAANRDARELVRLVQCSQCSRPFRVPISLPCGQAVCRQCLPTPHARLDISYPDTPGRQRGIICPIEECLQEHPLGECNVDVTLSKIMEAVEATIATYASAAEDSPLLLQELVSRDCNSPSSTPFEQANERESEQQPLLQPQSHTLHGGRIFATYTLAAQGGLQYTSDVAYNSLSPSEDEYEQLDDTVLTSLKEATSEKLECSVCYNTMYEPVTASCGHTFCRTCLARTLDHTQHCPWCRQPLPMPPSLERHPNNVRLVKLLQALYPETVAARAEAVAGESLGDGDLNVPLFVCALSFPSMPTFLHIFEPRYRLMIRRAVAGNSRFGMLMYNQTRAEQGQLGRPVFLQYGTMLQILSVQMLPDGRSLIETRGAYRFRVLESGMLDGYHVGRVERVDDISFAEEERLEAQEILLSSDRPSSPMESFTRPTTTVSSPESANSGSNSTTPDSVDNVADPMNATNQPHNTTRTTASIDPNIVVESLSTRQLHALGLEFIMRMQQTSAPWLHQRIIDAYGGPPPDPALFPYWFATVLPIAEIEKYQLLRITSVRERLKIVVGWIRSAERQRW